MTGDKCLHGDFDVPNSLTCKLITTSTVTGILDALEDFDKDGIPDYLDPDDDNDGVPDEDEDHKTKDSDRDGIPDIYDEDVNGDGITDSEKQKYELVLMIYV